MVLVDGSRTRQSGDGGLTTTEMRLRASLPVCLPYYLVAIQCYSCVQFEQSVIGHSFFCLSLAGFPRSYRVPSKCNVW